MFCGGQMLEGFFLLYLWSPLRTALSLDEQMHFGSIECKEENRPFLSILNVFEITTFHLTDLRDPFSCCCMNTEERGQLILLNPGDIFLRSFIIKIIQTACCLLLFDTLYLSKPVNLLFWFLTINFRCSVLCTKKWKKIADLLVSRMVKFWRKQD